MLYLTWLKQQLDRTVGRDVTNLASSAVHVASSVEWLQHQLVQGGQSLVDAWKTGSHMFGYGPLKDRIRAAFAVPHEREILIAAGASGAYRLVCEMLFAGRGCGVLVTETPYYEPMVVLPQRWGLQRRLVPRWPGGDFVDGVARALSHNSNVRAVVVANLHNPTGDYLDHAAVVRIVSLMRQHAPDAWLVIDEAFGDLAPTPGVSHASIDRRIITLSSLTKAQGLGDLRCGWITVDRREYPTALEDWALFENIGSKLLETLSAAALEHIDRWRADCRAHLARNRAIFAEWLGDMNARGLLVGDMPPHGCVAFPRLAKSTDSGALVQSLAEQHGVLVVPGGYFGPQWTSHIRIGFGGPTAMLEQGLTRLTEGLASSTGTN